MSRSVHTRPLWVRAASRARDPFAPRGRGDARLERAARRALAARGLLPHVERARDDDLPRVVVAPPRQGLVPGVEHDRDDDARDRLPRVVVQPARAGHVHAASKADVEGLLARLGPSCFHGLRSIELVRGASAELALGRFAPVGRILLFDLPAPPWRVRVAPADAARLARAGAVVTPDQVTWPGDSLRELVLHDALLHELGHHLLQHHAAKRRAADGRVRTHTPTRVGQPIGRRVTVSRSYSSVASTALVV